eukprot:NODE_920_length_3051_cov_0.826897.p3 type:complete len:187 gc:universal NODE_920_length_3051_cov_0.826897:807-1367(+)
MLVCCLGDSLTQYGIRTNGWISLLNSHFERKVQFISKGYSGYNTRWILSHLHQILKVKCDIFIVWLGTNDCTEDEKQYVDIDLYKSNLTTISETIKNFCDPVIITISPIPTVRQERKQWNEYTDAIRGIENFIDLSNLDWCSEDYVDDLHLSEKGNYKIFESVSTYLESNFKISMELSDWKELKNE